MSPTSFNLVDDGVNAAAKARSFDNLISFGGTRTVTEGALPAGWALTKVSCSISTPAGTTLGTVSPNGTGSGPSASFDLKEANTATCTFTNAYTKAASSVSTDIHDASHNVVTTVPAGTNVHDQATVTGSRGTPSGTVTFSWFTNGSCDGTPAATSAPVAVSGGVADATAFAQAPTSSGSFSFRAAYSGDDLYDGSTGACEPLTVTKVASSTVTDIHDASHDTVSTVPAGTKVHDQANVSGAVGTPTGTVTFSWFTNGSCNGNPAATSSPVALSNGVADATAFVQAPSSAGRFSFRATYSGDASYDGSTGACEPLAATLVDLAITKSVSVPAVSAGQPFNYKLAVRNVGESDATTAATVVDVLPAAVTFRSLGTLPAGVTCDVQGRTVTCTIPAALLGAGDDAVVITLNVTIDTTPATFPVTNKSVVTSADDEAPCTTTATDITCEQPGTNNYSDVVVGFTEGAVVIGAPTAPGSPTVATPGAPTAGDAGSPVVAADAATATPSALAFTGSATVRLLGLGVVLAAIGGLLLVVARRRRGRDARA
jgi:uncharacterized repeat protein (TIGR01451 family)